MNEHLRSVREFHVLLLIPQQEHGVPIRFSDMEIIRYQTLLMEKDSEVLKAIQSGEMAEILLGLVDLAYVALAAIGREGGDVIEKPVFWRLDGFVLSVMQILSDTISQCTTGHPKSYSAVYCLCIHLARSFVNADFDKAFQKVHQHTIARLKQNGESFYSDSDSIHLSKLKKSCELSDCLYE